MPSVTTIPTLAQQLTAAVEQVRRHRHHQDCMCFQFRNGDREAFCTGEESTWSSILDRLIERARESLPTNS